MTLTTLLNPAATAGSRRVYSRTRSKNEEISFSLSPPPSPEKLKPLSAIMSTAKHAVLERDDYSDIVCEQCGSGDREEELLLCDKCDKGFHMKCLRPIVPFLPMGSWLCQRCSGRGKVKRLSQRMIIDFFKIQRSYISKGSDGTTQETKKRRRRSLVYQKKKRRLLPFTPSEDPSQRLKQMRSLATALKSLNLEFTNSLVYSPHLAPRSANQAKFEDGMQILSKEDADTLELCKAMYTKGECPPLVVVFDSCEGYTVEADGLIKDMTFISEYTGDVDYTKNRETYDGDSMMTLLLAKDNTKSLVICPDQYGNIARFISGINNHTSDGKKKQNCKCVRYNLNGECRVLLVATRDIAKGERLYYDYNGYENEYPTHHFL